MDKKKSLRNVICPNCGFMFRSENPYYSKDYASVFLNTPKIHIFWCANCTYITETKRHKRFGLFPHNLSKSFPLSELFDKNYFHIQMNHLGGLFGFHIHRLIWYSINQLAQFQNGQEHNEKATIALLFEKKTPPISIATAIWAVSNTSASVSLEDQLEMCIYQSSDIGSYACKAEDIISAQKDWQNQELVLQILKDFRQAIL